MTQALGLARNQSTADQAVIANLENKVLAYQQNLYQAQARLQEKIDEFNTISAQNRKLQSEYATAKLKLDHEREVNCRARLAFDTSITSREMSAQLDLLADAGTPAPKFFQGLLEARQKALAEANNRAQKKVNRLPASVVPSWVEDSPVVREFLTPLAFSCWNDRYPSNNAAVREAAGSNPRASRANFEKRLNYLLSLCGENPSMAGVSPAYGRRILVERGMTEAQAKRTYLYLNPESANSQEGWATSTVDSANRHPFPAKFWKDTITGYRGAKTKAVLVRYNNHVFVSSPDLNP